MLQPPVAIGVVQDKVMLVVVADEAIRLVGALTVGLTTAAGVVLDEIALLPPAFVAVTLTSIYLPRSPLASV